MLNEPHRQIDRKYSARWAAGKGGFDLLMRLMVYSEFDEEWGKCKTAQELTREQAAWIRKSNRQKQKESGNVSTGKGAKKRTRWPSASGEADVQSNKKSKQKNADAESPVDNTHERETAGLGSWGIWDFGKKLGKKAQDAGLALHEKFRQYNAKGDDA